MSLPKSGKWMDGVKSSGGILMLVAALYFLRPLLPWMRTFASPAPWFLIASIVIGVAGLVLGAIHLSFHGSRVDKGRKGLGIALVLAGIFGAWTWKLTPKQHLPWITDEQVAYERARAEHKGVMVDFAASWCVPCEEMELTFGDSDVYDAITQNFIPLKLDVSDDNSSSADKRERYGAATLPSVVFMSSDHTIVGRVNKLLEPDDMLEVVRPATKLAKANEAPAASALAWVSDEKRAFDQAKTDHKGVLVAFDAEWCVPCKELNQRLANDQVKPVIQSSFVPLKLDVTNDTEANQAVRTRYGASSLPTLVFVSTDGAVLGRVTELSDTPRLLDVIQPAAAKLRN
jgi:thiol:disulfide interchange protein